MYAEAFGWTPEQVDNIPLTIEPWLLPIYAAMQEAQNESIKAAQKKAEDEAKRHR